MKGIVRVLFVYLLFGAVSGGIHFALIWRLPAKSKKSEPVAVRPLAVEVSAPAIVEEPPAAEPKKSPDPVEKEEPPLYRETTKQKEKEQQPEPTRKPEDEVKPLPEPPKEVAKKEQKTEEKPKEEKKEEKPAKPEITTLTDYRKYLARSMPDEGADYSYVPKIQFGENSTADNREIMRYFGMELIAYPKDRGYYVYMDPDQDLYSRSGDYDYLKNFSNRVIFRESAYFTKLREEAARRIGVSASELSVAQLLKPRTANYIAWKESIAAEDAGVKLDEVETCEATFARSSVGVWIVRIDRLRLKDGKTVAVRDREWKKVGGGDK